MTRLGLGTAPLGGLYEHVSDRVARATVRSALDLGLKLFDTAPLYGNGSAEVRLGQALTGEERGGLTVCTKVGRLIRDTTDPNDDLDPARGHDGEPMYKDGLATHCVFDFTYDGALRSLEESLRRLQLDRVDIAYVHDPYDHLDTAVTGAYRALSRLRDEGVIGAIGLGIDSVGVGVRFLQATDIDCILIAGRLTLLDQQALVDLLPRCIERGVSILAAGVFNSGILADPDHNVRYDYAPSSPAILRQVQRLRDTCNRFEIPLQAAAIQLPLRYDGVSAVVVGARSPQEIEANVRFFEFEIPDELWHTLAAENGVPDIAS